MTKGKRKERRHEELGVRKEQRKVKSGGKYFAIESY
jgi:hypothetical protein